MRNLILINLFILTFLLKVSLSPGQHNVCSIYDDVSIDTIHTNIKNTYFDTYFIDKQDNVFMIFAEKTIDGCFTNLVRLMNDFDRLPLFMPGYKEVVTVEQGNNTFITGIDFKPGLSPFHSLFTNEVEVHSDSNIYIQCWKQLAEDDIRATHCNKYAPIINEGFWKFQKMETNKVRMLYYLIIQPQTNVPEWFFRWVAKNSYKEVFNSIIQAASELESGIKHGPDEGL